MEINPWTQAAMRILDLAFPGDKARPPHRRPRLPGGRLHHRVRADGIRSGGDRVPREQHRRLQICQREQTQLSNLNFIQDDAFNVEKYGPFDAVFCCGLYYHIDRPKQFLNLLSRVTSKVLILQTHFSTETPNDYYRLSELCENEGLPGRWFTEFHNQDEFQNRDDVKWAAWDNLRSFWVRREYLLQAIHDVGFDIVLEQFDPASGNRPGISSTL